MPGTRCERAPAGPDHNFGTYALYARKGNPMKRDLTPEDLRICAMVTNGYLNKEIASELDVSLEVATQRLKMIMRHVGASNRAMVAAWYVRRELSAQ